jgi:hypothetical protein
MYVERMHKRRTAASRYTRQQTDRWLAWLAGRLRTQDQGEFLLERMGPGWAPTTGHQRALKGAISAAYGVGAALIAAMVLGRDFGEEPVNTLLMVGVLSLFVGGYGGLREHRLSETLRWAWPSARGGLGCGLRAGLAVGAVVLLGLVAAVVGAALGLSQPIFDRGLGGGLLLALAVAAGAAAFGAFSFGALLFFWQGLQPGALARRTAPGDGLRRSARNALAVALASGATSGLPLWLVSRSSANAGPLYGPLIGLGIGLLFGLQMGGAAVLQHLLLRLVLWRKDLAPWRYVSFLDYAAERIFLRKVGGGYIFAHRMLLEWFADRWPDDPTGSAEASSD